MPTRHHHAAHGRRLRHINPVRARLLQVFGPADSWDNPLVGTKYDPALRQHDEQERRDARLARRVERHGRRQVRRDAGPESDHHTPDEV